MDVYDVLHLSPTKILQVSCFCHFLKIGKMTAKAVMDIMVKRSRL